MTDSSAGAIATGAPEICGEPLRGGASEAVLPELRLLLVEDDDVDARLIGLYAAAMAGLPVVVERAVSAEAALALAGARDFDLCIADFWLGCETSLRLLGEIACRHPGLPALVLTSLSTPDVRLACRQAGAVHFLGKDGLGPDTLRAAIEAAVRRPEPRQGDLNAGLPGLGAGPGEATAELNQHPELEVAAAALPDLSETLRLGVFERLLGAGPPGERALFAPAEVERLFRTSLGLLRGVFAGRAQRLDVAVALSPGAGFPGDAAGLAFLFHELACRASQQSLNESALAADLRSTEGGALRLRFTSRAATPTALGLPGTPLGPLCRQIMREHGGVALDRPGADGGLVFEAVLHGRHATAAEPLASVH